MEKIQQLFRKACITYQLLEDGDRVLVALSGGKDSLELVRLLGRQSKIYKPRISVEVAHVVMDNIPYASDLDYLRQFCAEAGVQFHVLHTCFDEHVEGKPQKPACFLCSWHRRKALFQFATENGFNKIALGHHMDDFLVTALMNMTFEGQFSSMLPSMPMEHYPLTVIRPLCLIPESMIVDIAMRDGFHKQQKSCPHEHETQRTRMTHILHLLELENPEARYSIWRALFGR